MPRIPFAQRRQSLVSPNQIRAPRATAAMFGGDAARGMVQAGQRISTFAQGVLEKKARENADLYISKVTSEARADYTRRATELRSTSDTDIAPSLDQYMQRNNKRHLEDAPSSSARARAEIALNAMTSGFTTKAITGDEVARTQRMELQFNDSHRNNRASVYDDFTQLNVVIAAEEAEIRNLVLPDSVKEAKIRAAREELGFDAVQGLIDSSESGARSALALLTDPKNPTAHYLNKSHKQKLTKYAETAIKQAEADKDRAIIRSEKQHTIDQRQRRNDLMAKYEKQGYLSDNDIKNSGLDAGNKQWFRDTVQGDGSSPPPPAEDRAEYFGDLWGRSGTTDPEDAEVIEQEALWARQNRFITNAEFNSIVNRATEERDAAQERLEKSMKTAITGTNPITGTVDPDGDALYSKAMVELDGLIRDQKDRGEPVYNLFDPNHKDYVWPRMQKYVRTFEERMKAMQRHMSSTTVDEEAEDAALIKELSGVLND